LIPTVWESETRKTGDMAEVRLTEEQEQALEHRLNVALVAGAGSGKTTVLTQRYLRILEAESHLSVRNILAITFTDRAAAEMLERIRARATEKCSGADADRWRTVREELMAASISTIHAFCAGLLRTYAPEAGVSPDFDTLDAPNAAILLEEAIAEAADPLNADLHEELRLLLRRWSAGRVRDVLRTILASLEVSRDGLMHAATSSLDEMVSEWASTIASLQRSTLEALAGETDLLSMLRRIESAAANEEDEGVVGLVGAVREARTSLESEGDAAASVRDILPLFTKKDFAPRRRFPGSKQRWRGEDIDVYKEACAAVAQLLSAHAGILSICADDKADRLVAAHLGAVARVASWTLGKYEARKREEGALDFTDLQFNALRLLESNPKVLREVRARYRYVMVDEFQDINSVQWRLIRTLVSDGETVARDKLFIVGDPLQSIYGFRHAEVELLEQACEEMGRAVRPNGERFRLVRMDRNFRSHPNIINFINFLFRGFLEEPTVMRQQFEPEFQALRAQRGSAKECGAVEVLAGLRSSERPPFAHEAACIARRIRDIIAETPVKVVDRESGEPRDAGFGDVAILLRGRTHLEELERALRRWGVPYVVASGIGFFEQPEVADLIAFLKFIASPWNDLASSSLLRSPLFSVTDEALFRLVLLKPRAPLWDKICGVDGLEGFDERDADALSQMKEIGGRLLASAGRDSPVRLIQELLDETGAWGSYAADLRGHQAIANIRKFLALVRHLNSPSRPLPDLVRVLELQAERGVDEPEAPLHLEGGDAIRITTIHAAKGLEFPIVFLADLGRYVSGRQSAVLVDRELGLGLALPSGGARDGGEKCSLRIAAEERLRRRERAEEKRLLYVAATRARDMLVLSGEVRPGSKLDASASNWMVRTLALLGIDELCCGDQNLTVGEENPVTFRLSVLESTEEPPAQIQVEGTFAEDAAAVNEAVLTFLRQAPLKTAQARRELRVTALAEYARCPHAYYLSEEAGAGSVSPAETGALARGSFIHRVLQLSHGRNEGDLRDLCEVLVRQVPSMDSAERERLCADAVEAVRRAGDSMVGDVSREAEQVLAEVPISFNAGRATLNGMIDRLCIMPENKYVLVDFKTDRVEADGIKKKVEEYKVQLDAYALGVSKAFSVPLDDVRPVLCFTSPGEAREWRLTAHDAEALVRQLEDIGEKVARGEFPAVESEACQACLHRELGICKAGGAWSAAAI